MQVLSDLARGANRVTHGGSVNFSKRSGLTLSVWGTAVLTSAGVGTHRAGGAAIARVVCKILVLSGWTRLAHAVLHIRGRHLLPFTRAARCHFDAACFGVAVVRLEILDVRGVLIALNAQTVRERVALSHQSEPSSAESVDVAFTSLSNVIYVVLVFIIATPFAMVRRKVRDCIS